MKLEDTREYKLGLWGEESAEKLLEESGCMVVSKRLYTGEGAPMLHGFKVKLILPDLDVSRQGKRWWVEVKTKKRPGYYGKRRCETHAVDCSNWTQYFRVQKEMGSPVFLMVIEKLTGNILLQSIDKLLPGLIVNEGCLAGTYSFPRSSFELWATLGQGEMFTLRDREWLSSAMCK